jgi:hypothetical protein
MGNPAVEGKPPIAVELAVGENLSAEGEPMLAGKPPVAEKLILV